MDLLFPLMVSVRPSVSRNEISGIASCREMLEMFLEKS